jgi:NADH dehydrogenase
VEGDLKDASSLVNACGDVQGVISTASSMLSRQQGDSIEAVDHQGQLALVASARQTGVDRFVFVSFRENPAIQFPLTIAKRAVERALLSSGMAYTILQASYFMEVWLTPMLGFDYAAGKVRIYGDGSRRLSWVSYKDVARIAAAAVDQPRAANTTLDVGGPEALTPFEVIRLFEAAGTSEIAAETVKESDLAAQLQAATDPLQQSFAGLMLQYARGDAMDISNTRALFPFALTSVRDYVSTVLARA